MRGGGFCAILCVTLQDEEREHHAPCRNAGDRDRAAGFAPPDPGRRRDDVPELGQRPTGDKISAVGAAQNADETRELLTAWALLYPNGDYYQWGIVEKSTGQVFGSISVFTSSSAEPERDPWPGFDHTNGVWEVATASAGSGGTTVSPPKR